MSGAAAGPAGFARSLAGQQVCVTGLGVSGPPAARLLAGLGARVTVLDSGTGPDAAALADGLAESGVRVLLGQAQAGPDATIPAGTSLVVTTPGWRPDTPLLVAAARAGIPVIGNVELAWRIRPVLPGGGRQQWLAVTGTNGKTTTVRMVAAMLAAAGYRSIAAGNVGTSIVTVAADPEPYPVVAVELSSFQLHWSSTVRPLAAAILNVAGHHLDWHGDIESYAADKGKIFADGTIAICNGDDARSSALAAAAASPARVVTFRLGEPGPGEIGVTGDALVDRAFGDGVRLAGVADVRPAAPHNVADALAAAALARAYGAPAAAVQGGLAAFEPEPHRISLVAQVGGVDYVDDSKASNPHAAAASLAAFPSVIWVAGGLFKGADEDLDALVRAVAPRLRAVLLLGADRDRFRQAVTRHAADIPVIEAAGTDTGVMDLVVGEAARLARPGDTVLLAPAAQSFDMFRDYPARGAAFAAAVARLAAAR